MGVRLHAVYVWRILQGEEPLVLGACKELLRRRQAVLVRKVKQDTEPALWQQLNTQHPTLVSTQ